MSKREADEAWAFHRALAGETKPHYEASRVDASTWRVMRWKGDGCLVCNRLTEHRCHAADNERGHTFVPFTDEALLRDLPADTTEEQAIQVAVERGSWA